MARRPEFDREAVVRRAMEVFWVDGFQAASISRLSAAMQLRPGSIYAAFHSKDALFREALQVYLGDIRELASATSDPRALLEGWFAVYISRSRDAKRGCLLLNTSTELQQMDADSAQAVLSGLAALETRFAAALKKLKRPSERPSPLATARLLVAALAGISTLSRAGASEKTLRDVADAALRLV